MEGSPSVAVYLVGLHDYECGPERRVVRRRVHALHHALQQRRQRSHRLHYQQRTQRTRELQSHVSWTQLGKGPHPGAYGRADRRVQDVGAGATVPLLQDARRGQQQQTGRLRTHQVTHTLARTRSQTGTAGQSACGRKNIQRRRTNQFNRPNIINGRSQSRWLHRLP